MGEVRGDSKAKNRTSVVFVDHAKREKLEEAIEDSMNVNWKESDSHFREIRLKTEVEALKLKQEKRYWLPLQRIMVSPGSCK